MGLSSDQNHFHHPGHHFDNSHHSNYEHVLASNSNSNNGDNDTFQDSSNELKLLIPQSEPQSSSKHKKVRQRTNRACDACRKHKVKCLPKESGACQNCLAACRRCTFETASVKRERPPTKREVEQLNLKIEKLEKLLNVIAPNFDVQALPRTADQARSIIQTVKNGSDQKKKPHSPGDARVGFDDVVSALRLIDECRQSSDLSFEFKSQELSSSARSLAQNLRLSLPESILEKMVEDSRAADIDTLPPPDLADSLVDLFFEKVNPYENILHKGEFMRDYHEGLTQTNRSFRGLCFAVFAAGSRFSFDPRVFPPSGEDCKNPKAAGALFEYSALTLLTCDLPPFTLHDLQATALVCYFTSVSCSPITAWSFLATYLRRAQGSGAHRENTTRWKESVMVDQLRKRAVWYLASMEVQLSRSLGRSLTLKHQELDLKFPLCIDDDTLTKMSSVEANQSPGAATELAHSGLDLLTGSPNQKAWKALFSLRKQFGSFYQKLSFVKASSIEGAWNCDRTTILAFSAELDVHLQKNTPEEGIDFKMTSPQEFLINARLHATILISQIMARRLLIGTDSSEVGVCLKYSTALIDILDHIRNRGLLEFTVSWLPYVVPPPALTLLFLVRGRYEYMAAVDRANAWAGVHRCINILNAIAPLSYIAERLTISIDQLVQVCIEEELFHNPKGDVANQKKRNADDDAEGVSLAENHKSESAWADLRYSDSTHQERSYLTSEALHNKQAYSGFNNGSGSSSHYNHNTHHLHSSATTSRGQVTIDKNAGLGTEEIFGLAHSKLETILLEHPGKTIDRRLVSNEGSELGANEDEDVYGEGSFLELEFIRAEDALISEWARKNGGGAGNILAKKGAKKN